MAKAIASKAKKASPKKTAVKKAAPKKAVTPAKAAKEEKTIHIKYDDKSAGQPEMVVIFEAIRKLITPYANKRNLKLHADTYGQLNLVSHQPVEIAGKMRNELWFISALIQKGYVGFYYTPINGEKDIRKNFSPEFMKCLKGKGCFHIVKKDPSIMAEIKKAIELGYDAYVKKGWI
jgi:hypothetical protein